MTHDDAFLQAILESPDDDGPRLIYSDWLTEQGDPRGAFIRVQCQLAKFPPDDPSRDDLELEEAGMLPAMRAALVEPKPPAWARKIPVSVRKGNCAFERGFVARLMTSPGKFLKDADAIMRATPLQHLCLIQTRRVIQAVADCPHLARLRSLDLADSKLGNKGLEVLLASPHIAGLRKLGLAGNNLLVGGVDALAKTPALSGLTELDLNHNRVHDAGVEAIAGSEILANLEVLSLEDSQVRLRGINALSRSKTLRRLTRLDLSKNQIGNQGVATLARADLPALTTLTLFASGVTSVGVDNLLAGSLPKLTRLELSDRSLETDIWRITPSPLLHGRLHLTLRTLWHQRPEALARSPLLAVCVGLRLHGCAIGDGGAVVLANAPEAAGLTELDLGGNNISPAGIRALVESPHLGKVTKLGLAGNFLEEEGIAALLNSPLVRQLKYLDLRFANRTLEAYPLLARSDALAGLTRLLVSRYMPRPVEEELRERFGPRLRLE
jgi:uncharacterized protein (TIGR02996 family)